MRPLFELGAVIQPCTAAVTSTETNVFTVVTGTAEAIEMPADGGANPLTPDSVQADPTVETLMVPPVPT
jgi:hypothetical protein